MKDLDSELKSIADELSVHIKCSFMVRRDVWKHSTSSSRLDWDIAICLVFGESPNLDAKNFHTDDLSQLDVIKSQAVEWYYEQVKKSNSSAVTVS